MRIGRRVAKVLIYSFGLCLAILGGGLWCAYSYVTDSETAARLIKQYAARYLPRSDIDPGRVRLRPLIGELTLNNLQIYQRIEDRPFQALRIPWLRIGINPKKMLKGQLDFRQISVVQPTLRLCHRRDGTLNLQGLLADPWPGPWLDKTPPILIENGTLEVVPEEEDPPAAEPPRSPSLRPGPAAGIMVLRNVSLRIEQVNKLLFRFEGSAQGDSLDQLHLERNG